MRPSAALLSLSVFCTARKSVSIYISNTLRISRSNSDRFGLGRHRDQPIHDRIYVVGEPCGRRASECVPQGKYKGPYGEVNADGISRSYSFRL